MSVNSRYARWDAKVENVRRFLVRNADDQGVVTLGDVDRSELNLLGMTERGLVQFVRLNQAALGGYYVPSKTYAKFILQRLAGKPLIEILD